LRDEQRRSKELQERDQDWLQQVAILQQKFCRYEYALLRDGEIRLIELLPSTLDGGPCRKEGNKERFTLRINFQTCQLDSEPLVNFEALSYCWGDSTKRYPVIGNDSGILWITENLANALSKVKPEGDPPRLMWADGLCINQEDVDEKSRQVRMMGDIYRRAMRVLICLGEQEDGSEQIPEIVAKLSRAEEMIKDEGLSGQNAYQLSRADFKRFGLPSFFEFKLLEALAWLEKQPWFGRVWVIQELLLAREAVFLFGHWNLSYDLVIGAILFARNFRIYEQRGIYQTTLNHFVLLISLRKAFEDGNGHFSLGNLLVFFQGAAATDPRDKVYALLSLTEDEHKITVDYNKSRSQVYQDAAEHVLRFNLDVGLQILCFGGYSSKLPPHKSDCPSWVPAWDVGRWQKHLYGVFDLKTMRNPELDECVILDNKLSMHVLLTDEVLQVESVFPDASSLDGIVTPLSQQWWKMLIEGTAQNTTLYKWYRSVVTDESKIYEPTNEPLTYAFWQAFWSRPEKAQFFEDNKEMMRGLMAHFRCIEITQRYLSDTHTTARAILFTLLMLPTLCQNIINQKGIPDVTDFKERGQMACGHRMMRTKKGYLGLAPEETKAGDGACFFKAGSVPFVIRPTEAPDEFLLIGECSVHGLAAAEAWDASKSKSIWLV